MYIIEADEISHNNLNLFASFYSLVGIRIGISAILARPLF